jgi:hypothetical protein
MCSIAAWALHSGLKFSIEPTEVRVHLFRFTLRKIALSDIEFADRTWHWWNEHYNNTFNPKRIVRLRRRTGWCKNLIITPPNAALFLEELAIRGVVVR